MEGFPGWWILIVEPFNPKVLYLKSRSVFWKSGIVTNTKIKMRKLGI